MAKPKAQTLQQRFGFMDKDLTTPKHDEMMVWLRENCTGIVGQLFYEAEWRPDVVSELKANAQTSTEKRISELKQEISELQEKIDGGRSFYQEKIIKCEQELSLWTGELGEPPPKPDLESSTKSIVLEKPIVSYGYKSEYIIGFADLFYSYEDWKLQADYNAWEVREKHYLIKSNGGVDRFTNIYNVYFEAKTTIPSMGELIRQIQMYRQYTHGEWVIVSPDDRFAEMFKDQGIYFYKYPEIEYAPELGRPKRLRAGDES